MKLEDLKQLNRVYYKVQVFDKITMSWVDVQRTYNTPKEAKKAIPASKTARLMKIDGKKRTPIMLSALLEA